ncbi:hypothetical protein BKA00_000451 [Actinomadura coerulea]|uniref:Uncharacterized protein n=1 Tax=Actinomadura coerulea TaxID=46159 RepID=A0A7X0FTR5_9ACTN|nr:hypothetical protein [Actinomadura coerulea]MBB6393537.1 hypothetical protein [Actinomadura coerulea]GGP92161.1 hypothetical protein GCM10010187_04490 [Actinomadura coerulea]
MAELTMTSGRWDELTALLQDEQRLRSEFPKVADYLDMAPGLAGTGDDQVDAQFDLRFVHYMTGGHAVSQNPYWDIVEPFVIEEHGRRVVNGGRSEGSARLAYAQLLLQASYACAIPSPQTIAWVANFCTDRPIVELGAGRGYWAAQLARAGLSVDAYDSEPPDKTRNASFPKVAGQADVWHPVRDLTEFAIRAEPADYVLVLCWPPGWGDTMSSEALTLFEEAGGERLVYIGERKGGKTGNDAFFTALSARWRLESVDPHFVSWWTDADVAQGWVRA